MRLHTRLVCAMGGLLLITQAINAGLILRLGTELSVDPTRTKLGAVLDAGLGDGGKHALEALLQAKRLLGTGNLQRQSLALDLASGFFAFFVLELGGLIAASLLLSRRLSKPLSDLVSLIRTIPEQDASYRIPLPRDAELAQLAMAMNQMLGGLEAREALLARQSRVSGWQEVASYLNHQLKNPLTSMNLACANLEHLDPFGPGSALSPVQAVDDPSARRLRELNREQLAILRAESDRLSAMVSRFRQATVCPTPRLEAVYTADLFERLKQRFAALNMEISSSDCAGTCVRADPGLLEEALSNLIRNSHEASLGPGQSTPCRVYLESSAGERSTGITVRDSNRDIPDRIAQRVLCEPFTTKAGGSGLGLTFVRTVTSLHGGNVEAARGPGGGLEFTLTLPSCSPKTATGGSNGQNPDR